MDVVDELSIRRHVLVGVGDDRIATEDLVSGKLIGPFPQGLGIDRLEPAGRS